MRSHSAEELRKKAGEFAAKLAKKDGAATILALSGDLGAGKTTFAQGIAGALGIEEQVTSPTFVIENIYALEDQRWEKFIHIDAYRLKSAHELEVLGWHEIASDPGNLIVLEWPERVQELLLDNATSLHFAIEGEGRIITSDGGKDL